MRNGAHNSRIAGKKREKVRNEDVTGLKYFDKLHFDQYCMLVLLFLFNPVVRSLRAIEQASELRKVQRKLGCQRASRFRPTVRSSPACSSVYGPAASRRCAHTR